jgi:hypothetical protein
MKRSASKASNISRERLERAARIYSSATFAGEALGIAGSTFSRICQEQGILTPAQRRKIRRTGDITPIENAGR